MCVCVCECEGGRGSQTITLLTLYSCMMNSGGLTHDEGLSYCKETTNQVSWNWSHDTYKLDLK